MTFRGYTPCACGGCFEIAFDGGFCDDCEDAGCPDRADPSDTNCQVEPEPESVDFPGFTPKA